MDLPDLAKPIQIDDSPELDRLRTVAGRTTSIPRAFTRPLFPFRLPTPEPTTSVNSRSSSRSSQLHPQFTFPPSFADLHHSSPQKPHSIFLRPGAVFTGLQSPVPQCHIDLAGRDLRPSSLPSNATRAPWLPPSPSALVPPSSVEASSHGSNPTLETLILNQLRLDFLSGVTRTDSQPPRPLPPITYNSRTRSPSLLSVARSLRTNHGQWTLDSTERDLMEALRARPGQYTAASSPGPAPPAGLSAVQIHTEQLTSHEPEWAVRVQITHYDHSRAQIAGLMEADGVNRSQSVIVTSWIGQIIDLSQSTEQFWTGSVQGADSGRASSFLMGSSSRMNDLKYWGKTVAFEGIKPETIYSKLESDDRFRQQLNARYILMRWKETNFVNCEPDQSGLSIQGFYFVCLDKQTGKIEAYYYDPASSPYQRLTLKPTGSYGSSFGTMTLA